MRCLQALWLSNLWGEVVGASPCVRPGRELIRPLPERIRAGWQGARKVTPLRLPRCSSGRVQSRHFGSLDTELLT